MLRPYKSGVFIRDLTEKGRGGSAQTWQTTPPCEHSSEKGRAIVLQFAAVGDHYGLSGLATAAAHLL